MATRGQSTTVKVLQVSLLAVLLAGLIAGAAIAAEGRRRAPQKKAASPVYEVSDPIAHKNLAIFLIYGKDRIKATEFITLEEAMKQKKVVVHETGTVTELVIENGGNVSIYVQSGDIVKGGKQDRVLQFDIIIPPKSGKIKVRTFCVERGRWSRRGKESLNQFSSSKYAVAGKNLKLATRLTGDQGEVWRNVTRSQGRLSANVGGDVQSGQSGTSLQLTLENKKVKEAVAGYEKRFAGMLAGKKNVIGFAVAVNGKVSSADVYASSVLFKKLWPKMLNSAAVEAVAEYKKDAKFKAATPKMVKAMMEDASKGVASQKRISKRVRMMLQESKANARFTTVDAANSEVLHDSFINKE